VTNRAQGERQITSLTSTPPKTPPKSKAPVRAPSSSEMEEITERHTIEALEELRAEREQQKK